MTRVSVRTESLPYAAELHGGRVRIFVADRLTGSGAWCLGRIFPVDGGRLGVPRYVVEALERELCAALLQRAA
jgi:hypothetical protein